MSKSEPTNTDESTQTEPESVFSFRLDPPPLEESNPELSTTPQHRRQTFPVPDDFDLYLELKSGKRKSSLMDRILTKRSSIMSFSKEQYDVTMPSDDPPPVIPQISIVRTDPSGESSTLDEFEIDQKGKKRKSCKKGKENSDDMKPKKKRGWIPFFSLFSYASKCDLFQMLLGLLATILSSWSVPTLNVIFGQVVNTLVHYEAAHYHRMSNDSSILSSDDDIGAKSKGRIPLMDRYCDHRVKYPEEQFVNNVTVMADYDKDYLLCQIQCLSGGLFTIALAYIALSYLCMLCFELAAFNQSLTIRKRFFASILRQDIEWFDCQEGASSQKSKGTSTDNVTITQDTNKDSVKSTEFSTRVSNDLKRIECGMNENLCLLIYFLSSMIANAVYALLFGWKLALAIFCTIGPVVAISSGMLTKIQSTFVRKEMKSYGEAGSVANEIFTSIRTVFAFGGESKALEQYDERLAPATRSGYKRSVLNAFGNALTWAAVYCGFALGVWYGVHLILDHEKSGYSVGTIIVVFWCAAAVGWNLGYTTPYLESVQIACACAQNIYKIIERKPKIQSNSETSSTSSGTIPSLKLPPTYDANIHFRDVHFTYPSRPQVRILQHFNLKISSGEVVALVGPSGSGKSTLVQLLQRFYDPTSGGLYLGGFNIRELDVGWLREQFGVVGQEPVLFDTTIRENIQLGAPRDRIRWVTEKEIEQAAKEANAHEFICRLPDGYETRVGERGAQLSGGQKQRIAIARALLREPKILLLDEATSALDLQSEAVVQAALDRASKGRTTIIIAHRLSTIINANRIVCLNAGGSIAEVGTHAQLMDRKQAYYDLVTRQLDNNSGNCDEIDISAHAQDSTTAEGDVDPNEDVVLRIRKSIPRSGSRVQQEVTEVLEDQDRYDQYVVWRIIRMVFQSRVTATLGVLCSTLFGLCVPIYAFLFGNFVNVFTNHTMEENGMMIPEVDTILTTTTTVSTILNLLPGTRNATGSNRSNSFGLDDDYLREESLRCCFEFLALAGFAFVTSFFQLTFFSIASQRLTTHLRLMSFNSIMTKEVSWFDRPSHSSGALCAQLANDPAEIQGSTGPRIAMFCQALSTLMISIAFGFYTCWNLSLVALVFVPVIAYSANSTAKVLGSQASKEKDKNAEAARIGQEAMVAIRTIASLHKEDYFEEHYSDTLEQNVSSIKRKFHRKAFSMGCALGTPLVAYATTFLYGGYLIANHDLTAGNFFKVIEAMIFGAVVFGQACFFSSDFHKAKQASVRIFRLIDSSLKKRQIPGINPSDYELNRCQGEIEFCSVGFSYPGRQGDRILKGVSFKVRAGEKVALVGHSGSGKSTVIQLLERFYEPDNGRILLDGVPISTLNHNWLRSQMALVSQEPLLFNTSIRENISYGDNTRESIPLEQIQEAARRACIADFIEQLPDKYETQVGLGGCLLSGGQKQRIAIARALIRDPAILLLDEATSALDSNSENQIQETIDAASRDRTCIIIAHRLSSIAHVDKIICIDRGVIVEQGTHQALLDRRGHYWNLVNQQQLISKKASACSNLDKLN